MASVKFEHISKNFEGKVQAVDDFCLEIADREFVVLIGPSGCGKTTVLRLLAGLEDPDWGTMLIDGNPVNGVDPKDRNLALVNQSYALYPHLTVYRNLAFPLEIAKVPVDEIDRRVYAAARLLELEPILKQKPKTLSGGQMQRVAIGRSLVRKPKIFLMDEPFSNLDPQFRSGMREQILRLHDRISSSFLFVTHDQQEALTLADRIVVMKDGKIQQADVPQNIMLHPANKFVASFFGNSRINFVEGILRRISDTGKAGYSVDINGLVLPLPEERTSSHKAASLLPSFIDKKVCVGIRPEDFTNRESALKSGKHTLVSVTLGGKDLLTGENFYQAVFQGNPITVRLANAWPDLKDNCLEMAVMEEHIQVFDPESEMSLLD